MEELGKPLYQTCLHVTDSGCGIYNERPAPCRAFKCQWLRGVLEVDGEVDLEMRPDACGVIFDFQPLTAFGDVYTAWEIEPGASGREPAREIIVQLTERFLVRLINWTPDGGVGPGQATWLGPQSLVRQAEDLMWSWGSGVS